MCVSFDNYLQQHEDNDIRTREQYICNVNKAVQCLNDDKISSLNVNEIVDGHQKTILSLVWLIVQYHWRATISFEQCRDVKLAEVLRDWCLNATQ